MLIANNENIENLTSLNTNSGIITEDRINVLENKINNIEMK